MLTPRGRRQHRGQAQPPTCPKVITLVRGGRAAGTRVASPESTGKAGWARPRRATPRALRCVFSGATSGVYLGYSATPLFQRFEGCFKGPLPRHLPEVASRIPTQGSKGNGDSGRLVPRSRAGEQALQRDTPRNTESFATGKDKRAIRATHVSASHRPHATPLAALCCTSRREQRDAAAASVSARR